MSSVPFLVGQASTLTPAFLDAEGNAISPADNTIAWVNSNSTVATLVADSDTQTAVLTAAAVGTCVATATYLGFSVTFTAVVSAVGQPASGSMGNTTPT